MIETCFAFEQWVSDRHGLGPLDNWEFTVNNVDCATQGLEQPFSLNADDNDLDGWLFNPARTRDDTERIR
jgi:hypothetical protein